VGLERLFLDTYNTKPAQGVLRPVLEGLVDLLGLRGTREVLQNVTPPRSPIQDVLNQERAIKMGTRSVREAIEPENLDVLRRTPAPEFGPGAPVRRPQPTPAPAPQARPVGSQPTYTVRRGDPTARQDVYPAPRKAEPIGDTNQLRLGLTQPGRGGQIYSPAKSSTSPEAVAGSLRQTLGDVADAPGFPRYRGAEGQRAFDLDPETTRRIMQGLNPAARRAPGVPDPMRPMGVQLTDLSDPAFLAKTFESVDPRVAGALGLGSLAIGGDQILRNLDFGSESSPSAQEAGQLNELMSTILADASQQGGVYGELVLQNAPRDPSSYGSVQEYEAARDQFLNNITSGTFVEAVRIYEELQRQAAAAPSGEQTGDTVVTSKLTSELGSDDVANAEGAGRAEAERLMSPAAMAGTLEEASSAQGATDIRDAATPRLQPQMRMVSTALMQSLQNEGLRRMAEMGGANLEYAAARSALAPNASQSEMDRVRDLGLAAFRQNFPQFR